MTKVPNLAVTFLIGASTLIVPDQAAASRYEWIAPGGGNWSSAANWAVVDGPVGAGYPNLAGDVAGFNQSAVNRTITLTEPISLAQLEINDDSNVFLFGNGNGRLGFDTTSTAPDRLTAIELHGAGQHTISVPILLDDPVAITVYDAAGRLACTGGIAQTVGSPGLTKGGPGTLLFNSLASNTYRGVTHVRAGVLELQHFNATALSGPLIIGTGAGNVPVASVRLRNGDQIEDIRFVRVMSDGVFETGPHDERIGALTVLDGRVTIGDAPTHNAVLVASEVGLSGGTIQIARDSALGLTDNLLATSTPTQRALLSGEGAVQLNGATRTFNVANGPQAVDLEIQPSIEGLSTEGLTKDGPGVLRFTTGTLNEYAGLTTVAGGRVELARVGGMAIPGNLQISLEDEPAEVVVLAGRNLSENASVGIAVNGRLIVDGTNEQIDTLRVSADGIAQIGGASAARLTARLVALVGGRVDVLPSSVLRLGSTLTASPIEGASLPAIAGGGTLALTSSSIAFDVVNGLSAIDLRIACEITGSGSTEITKSQGGALQLDGSGAFAGRILLGAGQLFVNGSMPNTTIALAGGTLGGNGRTGEIVMLADATIAPGFSPGLLTTGRLGGYPELTFAVEVNGTTPGTAYDRLKVIGVTQLNDAMLSVTASIAPPPGSRFIIIDNDGADPVVREFAGLPEGATLTVGGVELQLTYRGGDGNDVELFSTAPQTYYLAEGATGGFFDDDVLIANPTMTEAAVTMTFLLEGGGTVVERRTIAPQSRVTVHVDQIEGLEDASPSVRVVSDNRVPLVVERTMFWDPTYYGGHTANAVAQPELKWVFAEGFQGFFDTYVLIANANPEPTTATITFLRENDTPIVKTVGVGAFARKTIYAGDYSEVVGRAFGIVVEATRPVIAERAMYFASLPGRLWSGGHANTGIAAPSTSWFHAEGATGTFFNTFILLSNPQSAPAHVTLRFLLSTGEVIGREKTIEPLQRMTINPAVEGDPRLENAAVSTVVSSDVPIVSERSMYWPGDALPFGEGHNSAGIVSTSTHWGLAEGRVGGPHQFQTYVLLANPDTAVAEATVTFLRENGAPPIVRTYSVPGTSRFNIDVATVQELQNESFGVRISVTNGVNIAVERSLYWNANGVFWSGGTNALAAPLP